MEHGLNLEDMEMLAKAFIKHQEDVSSAVLAQPEGLKLPLLSTTAPEAHESEIGRTETSSVCTESGIGGAIGTDVAESSAECQPQPADHQSSPLPGLTASHKSMLDTSKSIDNPVTDENAAPLPREEAAPEGVEMTAVEAVPDPSCVSPFTPKTEQQTNQTTPHNKSYLYVLVVISCLVLVVAVMYGGEARGALK